jgi:LacI family transcriptional regulator
VTLSAVATAAGVSLATASRAFKDPDRLATATRDRVLAAADTLGYRSPAPSPAGRTIGVIVPDIGNAVFGRLVRSVQESAWSGNHRILLASAHEDPSRERSHLLDLAGVADGILLCSPRQSADWISETAAGVPLVVVNGQVPGAAAVLMDVEQGMRQAVEHLGALGHRRIAYVPGPAASWANRRRLEAVTALAAGAALDLVVVGNQAADVQGGLAASAPVVASGVSAVIAYNDLVAVGVMAGARALGLHCPEDLSVVGIDDLDIAAAAEPGLSSVRVAVERSGALAVELLVDRMNGVTVDPAAVHLDSQLIVRGSTGLARRAGADTKDVRPA